MNDEKKTYRKEKLGAAADAVALAIVELENLVADYDESEGPFSSTHPKQGHANSLRQMKTILKALNRGRV